MPPPARTFPSPTAGRRSRRRADDGGFLRQWRMANSSALPADVPLLHDENGTLSLHFVFPTIRSSMLRSDPERLLLDYTRTMMGFLLFHARPEHIAMIGLGGRSLAKYCHRRLPGCSFTTVEISPEVIALRTAFRLPDDDDRFTIICADGADHVAERHEAYDVLLVDCFQRDGQPEQLSTASFYDHCRGALRPGGILVVNLCADDKRCDVYVKRIEDAFAGKIIAVEADEGENLIVFAGKDLALPRDFGTLAGRLRQLEADHPVDLERTAQKILRHNVTSGGRRPRRR